MKTLLACSRVLVLLFLAPALLADGRFLSDARQRADMSRPLIDMREVVGVVMSAERIDVYWLHTNELVEPVRSVLYRTSVSADGQSRLGVTRIREFEEQVSARVSGAGTNVQVLWNEPSGIFVSPVEGDALKYPQGKRIGYGLYALIRCHATECVAAYDVSGTQKGVFLDRDGNEASIPFALPHGHHSLDLEFDERGIFFVRHDRTALRAALVRRDRTVRYDVRLAAADPRAFHASRPGVTRHGADYVVAFVEFETTPDEVRVVTVSSDGTVSAPTRLMQVEEHRDLPNNVGGLSLASNGSRFLFGGSYVIGAPFLMSLDASLQPAGSVARPRAPASVLPHPDGSSFIVIWYPASPYLTIVRADGSTTAPIALMPGPRRRAVR